MAVRPKGNRTTHVHVQETSRCGSRIRLVFVSPSREMSEPRVEYSPDHQDEKEMPFCMGRLAAEEIGARGTAPAPSNTVIETTRTIHLSGSFGIIVSLSFWNDTVFLPVSAISASILTSAAGSEPTGM